MSSHWLVFCMSLVSVVEFCHFLKWCNVYVITQVAERSRADSPEDTLLASFFHLLFHFFEDVFGSLGVDYLVVASKEKSTSEVLKHDS
jgi:hypothetical protein